MKRLGQQNFLRQMFRVERAELMQFLNHLRRDPLRLPILWPAMHDAMADRRQFAALNSFLDPIHQHIHRRRVVRHSD